LIDEVEFGGDPMVHESDDDRGQEDPIPGIDIDAVLLRIARLAGSEVWSLSGPDWQAKKLDDASDEDIREVDQGLSEHRSAGQARPSDTDSA
jgi:hypothetical protein